MCFYLEMLKVLLEHFFKNWDVNNLYRWLMPLKLPVNGFQWVKDPSQCNDFIKNYNEKSGEGYFPEADMQYPKDV